MFCIMRLDARGHMLYWTSTSTNVSSLFMSINFYISYSLIGNWFHRNYYGFGHTSRQKCQGAKSNLFLCEFPVFIILNNCLLYIAMVHKSIYFFVHFLVSHHRPGMVFADQHLKYLSPNRHASSLISLFFKMHTVV